MRVVVGLLLFALSSCDCDPVDPLPIEPGCNPLLHDVECGLPYPSDFFLVDDDAFPSGKRVQIDVPAKMVTKDGLSADINDFIFQDGFSRQPVIVWTFGVRVDVDSVPGLFADPRETLEDGFAVALLHGETGERVPCFVDVDARADLDDREALILRPLVRLDETTRYVVAISGVKAKDGKDVPVPVAFERLRDARVGADAILQPLLAHYEDKIFPLTDGAGLDRTSLQLAWDFTTGSDEHKTADMFRARKLVLEDLANTLPTATITSFFDGPSMSAVFRDQPEVSWRFVKMRVTGPRVVDGEEPGALLFRDANGEVALNGLTTFDVTVIVPASVRDDFDPGKVLLYGHGFFGGRDELEGSSTRVIADRVERVAFAIDWVGMSTEDIGVVSGSIGSKTSEAVRFGERLPQAMMNWLTLTEAIRSGVLNDLSFSVGDVTFLPFRRPTSGEGFTRTVNDNNGGDLIFRTDDIGFMGISQGHILGAVHAALNPEVTKAVLQVGGAGFAHMMFRANPFEGFLFFMNLSIPDRLDQQKIAAHLQGGFDRFDPATYAPQLLDAEFPVGPPGNASSRRVLMQMGIGDSSVPNLGTTLHARYLGLPYVTSSTVAAPFGLASQAAPFEGSGLAVFDLGVDPLINVPADFPDENDVHEGLRRTEAALAQDAAFFADGVIINPCDGAPCGPLLE
ncbi:MAG: hypothetical protein Q8O67_03850 [Deltaproteobacteria bacterium]|nr:hypothetical protein [Deltaproteobacteria bacterium]